jgi:hypothetical protein
MEQHLKFHRKERKWRKDFNAMLCVLCALCGGLALHIYHSLNINPPAPICPHTTASHQNESIKVTGIPHHP